MDHMYNYFLNWDSNSSSADGDGHPVIRMTSKKIKKKSSLIFPQGFASSHAQFKKTFFGCGQLQSKQCRFIFESQS